MANRFVVLNIKEYDVLVWKLIFYSFNWLAILFAPFETKVLSNSEIRECLIQRETRCFTEALTSQFTNETRLKK